MLSHSLPSIIKKLLVYGPLVDDINGKYACPVAPKQLLVKAVIQQKVLF